MAEGVLKNSKKPRKAATTAAKTAELWKHHQVDMLYLACKRKQFSIRWTKQNRQKTITRCTTMLKLSSRRIVVGYTATELESVPVLFFRRDNKNDKKLSLIVVWATYCLCKRMRTGLNSFVSLAPSVPVSKKQRANGLYPFLDSLRTVPFFYPFLYKTCMCKRSNFVGTGACFYPRRSASLDV